MKVEILRENLKNGVGISERVMGKNLSLPILDNIFFKTQDSFLNLISTNLETTIKVWILAKIIRSGEILIPAKLISNLMSSLPNEKIIIEGKEQNLHIECGSLKTHIKGFNTEEYPIIPEFKKEEPLEIESKKFCQSLSQVIGIPMPSSARPEISGIYFSFFGKNLKLAATDSFRLAEKNIILGDPTKKEFSFILPQRPAREVLSILDGKEGNIKIYFASNQVLFELSMKELKHPQVQIISRLIEGEYPNYQDIIPNKFKTSIVLKREEFLNQIKTASLFSGKTSEVKILTKPDSQNVEILAKSPDVGESKSNIQAKVEGDQIGVSFNYKYLIDGLANIESSEVVFEISKEEGPCILKPMGDASYLYVVMPIKSI